MDISLRVGGGYRAGTPNPADKQFPELLAKMGAAPPDLTKQDLRYACSPIENQLTAESCTGNSTVGALELLENLQNLPFTNLSRLFAYYNGRMGLTPSEGDKDTGTEIRLAVDGLHKFGVCDEATWQYDLSKVTTRPSWTAYRGAWQHKITGYYAISVGGEIRNSMIETALLIKHPVVFGMSIFQSFADCTGTVSTPTSTETSLGGHALAIVGFDRTRRVFIVRNSWGTSWGDAGYCEISYDVLNMSLVQASDFWIMTQYQG